MATDRLISTILFKRIFFLLTILLLVALAGPAYSDELSEWLWPDRDHMVTEHISIKAGANADYRDVTGFGPLDNGSTTLYEYNIALTASPDTFLFSRAEWRATPNVVLRPLNFRPEERRNSSATGLLELRMPFKAAFLSVDTSFFLQYRFSSLLYGAKLDYNMTYSDGVKYQDGSDLSVGITSHFIGLAIDTPVTRNDSGDSFSRFGIYYQEDYRSRMASVDGDVNEYLLDVTERHAGLFFDVNKPVLVDGFIFRFYIGFGYGFRYVHPNSNSYYYRQFDGYSSLIFMKFDMNLEYLWTIGQNFGVSASVGYRYDNIMVLQSRQRASSFSNKDANRFRVAVMLSYNF